MAQADTSKTDLRKTLKQFYNPPSKAPVLTLVPPIQYLMVDGSGDPNTSEDYRDSMQALFNLFYTMKFMLKKRGQTPDFSGMPVEGLWSTPGQEALDATDKGGWAWTSMIAVPDFITPEMVEEARAEIVRKKGALAALGKVRLEVLDEGLSAQIMHIGPYSEEAPTIERLHDFIAEQGCVPRGRHHEIYMSDPRRAKPEKLKTIVRQPVERSGEAGASQAS